jgi:hypothetical protein
MSKGIKESFAKSLWAKVNELDFEPPNFKLHDRLFVEVLTFSDGYVILEFAQSSWHLMTNKNHVGAVESLSGGARGLMFFLL